MQPRRRKPASVRIGPSSPCFASSADKSGRLLPRGSAVRIGRDASVLSSPVAQLAERLFTRRSLVRGHVGEPVFRSRVAQLAEQRLDKAQVDGSFPYARTRSSRCSAVGSARASGAWGRRFEACHRDQSDVRLGVAVAQRQSRGLWTCWCRFDSGRSPPSALAIERVANSSGRAPGSYPGWSGFEPLATHQHTPRGGTGRRTGLRNRRPRACPFDSDRGDHDSPVAQRQSSALIRRRPVDRHHPGRPGTAFPQSTQLRAERSSALGPGRSSTRQVSQPRFQLFKGGSGGGGRRRCRRRR